MPWRLLAEGVATTLEARVNSLLERVDLPVRRGGLRGARLRRRALARIASRRPNQRTRRRALRRALDRSALRRGGRLLLRRLGGRIGIRCRRGRRVEAGLVLGPRVALPLILCL